MQSLIIKDLDLATELDRDAMAAVRGGTGKKMVDAPYWGPQFDITKSDFKFDASQTLLQSQDTVVNNGNNVAFASGITANVNPHQHGANTINFG